MTATAWGEDGIEDWERELSRPDGYPLVAMLAGSAILILGAIALFTAVDIDVGGHIAASLALAMLAAGLVFAGAWALTLRHATLGWNVVTGGVLAGVALMAVVMALAATAFGTQSDAQTVRLIRIDGAGEPTLPRGVKAGPITAATMDFMRGAIAERRRRIALTHDLGLDRLANASADMNEPALLRDCGRFARAAPTIDAMDKAFVAKARAYRTRLSGIVKDPGMRDEMLKGFDDSMGSSATAMADANKVSHRLLDQAGPLCTLLAARRWKPMGTLFMFASQGDLAAFNRLIQPWNDTVREAQELDLRQGQRMRESGFIDARSRL